MSKQKDEIKKTDVAVAVVVATSLSILSTAIVASAIEVSGQQTELKSR
ncbi:MAG: hypothetical protein ACKPCP_14130 [Sphaerospermopsis kisseleviana]